MKTNFLIHNKLLYIIQQKVNYSVGDGFFVVPAATMSMLTSLRQTVIDKNEITFLQKLNLIALTLYAVGGAMKLASLQFASEVFIVGSGALALTLLLTGATKGLERRK